MLKNIENEPKKVTFLFVYLEIKLEMTYLCSRFQIKSIDNQALCVFQCKIMFREEITSLREDLG